MESVICNFLNRTSCIIRFRKSPSFKPSVSPSYTPSTNPSKVNLILRKSIFQQVRVHPTYLQKLHRPLLRP
eukprot:UN15478